MAPKPSWYLNHWPSLWLQFIVNGIFLAVNQQPAPSFGWAKPPSFTLCLPGCPLYHIMPCRLTDLAAIFPVIHWFNAVLFKSVHICLCAHQGQREGNSYLQFPSFSVASLSTFCQISSFVHFCFWTSLFGIFPSLSLRCSSLFLLFSLHLPRFPSSLYFCSSVALFIHSHSLPRCHSCLLAFCAFWSSFIWAV